MLVLLHELAGEVEAGLALVDGDGDDVFAAVGEGEDGGGEGGVGCRAGAARVLLGVQRESGRGGGGGEQEAAAGEHVEIVGGAGGCVQAVEA